MSRSEFGRTSSGRDLSLDTKALLSIYRECLPWAAKVGGLKESELESLKLDDLVHDQSKKRGGHSAAEADPTNEQLYEADLKRREKRNERLHIAEYAGRRMNVDRELMTLIENEWEKPKSRAAVVEKFMDIGVTNVNKLFELIRPNYRKAGTKGIESIDANQCELNRRLIQAGHRMLSASTIQSLVKSIEICRFLGRSKGNLSIAESQSRGSGISAEARRAQSHHEVQQDDGPRRPAWANWVTSEILFQGRPFVLPPEPELPFASVSLGPQILNVSFITASSDSKLIAACSSNGSVAILSNGIELVATLTLHQRAATSCDFSPDSNFLVVSSDDCTVSIWSLIDRLSGRISGRCIRIIKHEGAARLCRYDPEGRLLCTSGSDCVAYMWFTPCWTNEANTPKFSAGEMQPIREHCRETASCIQILEGHTGHLTTCCWSDSKVGGHVFVTGSIDETMRIHRRNSAADLWECTECLKFTASISQCYFDTSGFMLVLSFYSQKSLLAYDMKSKRTSVIGTEDPNRPKHVTLSCSCFHKHLCWTAMHFDSGSIAIYSRRIGEWHRVAYIRSDFLDGLPQSCNFSTDGSALILGYKGKLRFWSTQYLIHIPDCLSLFKEIKRYPPFDLHGQNQPDDAVSCAELIRALNAVGYNHSEQCKIMDTLTFSPSIQVASEASLQEPAVNRSTRLLRKMKTIALSLACQNLQGQSVAGSDLVTTCNPIAFLFNEAGNEIGRTECCFNSTNPLFVNPILIRHRDDIPAQKLTFKIYNFDLLNPYKDFVCEASVLGILEIRAESLFSSEESEHTFTNKSSGTVRFITCIMDPSNHESFAGFHSSLAGEPGSALSRTNSATLTKHQAGTNILQSHGLPLSITLPQLVRGADCFRFFEGGMAFVQNYSNLHMHHPPAWLHLEAELMSREIFRLTDLKSDPQALFSILDVLGVLPNVKDILQSQHRDAQNNDMVPDWYDICLLVIGDPNSFEIERECLRKHVFPALKQLSQSLHVNFSWIESESDIISSHAETAGEASRIVGVALESLELCRIGRTKPKQFVLGMMTGKEGQLFPESKDPSTPVLTVNSRHSWVNDPSYFGLTVDELQVHSAFLRDQTKSECVFCFRDTKTRDSIAQGQGENMRKPHNNNITATMAAVQERLHSSGLAHRLLNGYTSLTSFSVFVMLKLWDIIYFHHYLSGRQSCSSVLDRIQTKQQTLLELYATGYVVNSRIKDMLFIFEKAAQQSPCHLLCHGQSGCGKTSLLAHFASSRLSKGKPCVYFFGGHGDDSLMQYLSAELLRFCLKPIQDEQSRAPLDFFEYGLRAAAAHLKKDENLFLVLDNVSSEPLTMIFAKVAVLSLDLRVRCIVSCAIGQVQLFRPYHPSTNEWFIPNQADDKDALRVSSASSLLQFHLDSVIFSHSEKLALTERISDRLDARLTKKRKMQIAEQDVFPVPLFIFTAAAREASCRVSRSLIKPNFKPKSVQDLFVETVLERSEFGWERDVIDDILCFMALSRGGIPLALMIQMVYGGDNRPPTRHNLMEILVPLRLFLKPWLQDCCDQFEFLHESYRDCVLRNYCVDLNKPTDGYLAHKVTLLHKKLSMFLLILADPFSDKTWRGSCCTPFKELIYHLCEVVKGDAKDSESLDTIVETICNLHYIHSVLTKHPLKIQGLLEQFRMATQVLKILRDMEDVAKSLQADAIDAQLQQVEAFEGFVLMNEKILSSKANSLLNIGIHESNEIVKSVVVQEKENFISILQENFKVLKGTREMVHSKCEDIELLCSTFAQLGEMDSKLQGFLDLGGLLLLDSEETAQFIQYRENFVEDSMILRQIFLEELKRDSELLDYGPVAIPKASDGYIWAKENISRIESLSLQMRVCHAVPWADLGRSWETLFTRKSFFLQFSEFLDAKALSKIRQTLFKTTEVIERLFRQYSLLFADAQNLDQDAENFDSRHLNQNSFNVSDQIALKGIWVFMEDFDLLNEDCSLSLVNRWSINIQKSNSQTKVLIGSDWHLGEKVFHFQDFVEILLRIAQARLHRMPFLEALDVFCKHVSSSIPGLDKSGKKTKISLTREVLCNEDIVSVLKSDVEGMLITHEKRLLSCYEHFTEHSPEEGADYQAQQKTLNHAETYLTLKLDNFHFLCKSVGLVDSVYSKCYPFHCVSDAPNEASLVTDPKFCNSAKTQEITFVEFVGFIVSCSCSTQPHESTAESLRLWLGRLDLIGGSQPAAFDPRAPAGSLWPVVGFKVRP